MSTRRKTRAGLEAEKNAKEQLKADTTSDGSKVELKSVEGEEGIKVLSEKQEIKEQISKRVRIRTDFDEFCENFDALPKNILVQTRFLLETSSKSVAQRAMAIKLVQSRLFFYRDDVDETYETFLAKRELREEIHSKSEFYERLSALQRVLFDLGLEDEAMGASSRTVEIARQNDFYLDRPGGNKAMAAILICEEDVSKKSLKNALSEYFSPLQIQASLEVPDLGPPENRDDFLWKPRSATSFDLLKKRLEFVLTLDLLHPRCRYARSFNQISTTGVPCLVKTKSETVRIELDLRGVTELCSPLDTHDDSILLSKLKLLGAMDDLPDSPLRASVLMLDVPSIVDSEKISRVIDFGRAFPGGFKELTQAFPDEIKSLDLGDECCDRFVVTFNKKKKAIVTAVPFEDKSAEQQKISSLRIDQIRALCSCLSKAFVYVAGPAGSGKTTLAAQVVASTLTTNSKARVLVISGRSASCVSDLIQMARERSLGILAPHDIVVAGATSSAFGSSKCFQRIAKERRKALDRVRALAKSLGVDDPDMSASSCEYALNFLVKAGHIVEGETLREMEETKKLVERLRGFELFAERPVLAEQFAIRSHCRIVGVCLVDLDRLSRWPQFDLVIADDVSSQLDIAIIASKLQNTKHIPRVICLGRDTRSEFTSAEQVILSQINVAKPPPPPGFGGHFMWHIAASLKEEAEWLVSLVKFAFKIHYEPADVLVFALSLKQVKAIEEIVRVEFPSMGHRPAVHGPLISGFVPSHRKRLVLISFGGAREVSQKELLERVAPWGSDCIVVFNTDKDWSSKGSGLDENQKARDLELVLGERAGELYDAELRSSTLYKATKLGEMNAVVSGI